jgi:hypothetical protein
MKNYNTGERFYQSYPYRSGKEEHERPLSWCTQTISPFLPKMNLISPAVNPLPVDYMLPELCSPQADIKG